MNYLFASPSYTESVLAFEVILSCYLALTCLWGMAKSVAVIHSCLHIIDDGWMILYCFILGLIQVCSPEERDLLFTC